MEQDIEWHLKTNEVLWQKWIANGITPGMSFVVDFHFYVPKREITDALVSSLEEAGFKVTKSVKRTLLFWRGWEIEASAKHERTLEYLNERTREFCQEAQAYGYSFDGFGAAMP